MKVITIYAADDGTRFDSAKECEKYEVVMNSVNNIMGQLRNNNALEYDCAIQQDRQTVKSCFNDFLELCEKTIATEAKVFRECREGKRHISHAEYVISTYSSDYPCLHRAMYRFECINEASGIEYEQPYFAKKEPQFKGRVLPQKGGEI